MKLYDCIMDTRVIDCNNTHHNSITSCASLSNNNSWKQKYVYLYGWTSKPLLSNNAHQCHATCYSCYHRTTGLSGTDRINCACHPQIIIIALSWSHNENMHVTLAFDNHVFHNKLSAESDLQSFTTPRINYDIGLCSHGFAIMAVDMKVNINFAII